MVKLTLTGPMKPSQLKQQHPPTPEAERPPCTDRRGPGSASASTVEPFGDEASRAWRTVDGGGIDPSMHGRSVPLANLEAVSVADADVPAPSTGRRARVVYWPNGGGLSRSARVVSNALASAGWLVDLVEDLRFPSSTHPVTLRFHRWKRWLRQCAAGARWQVAVRAGRIEQADLNVFLEDVVPSQVCLARRNVWIPNQEWMPFRWRRHLSALDRIWVKTRYAERIFQSFSPAVDYVGFSSFDRYEPSVGKEPRTFLHVAGRSRQKGTAVLLEAWRRNPGWPRLVVIQNPVAARPVSIPNVDYRPIRLDDGELRRLQNRCEFHLFPSEAEGFGHVLCESMGLGAIVLSTDAPPMNELVTDDRGILVAYDRTVKQGLGTNFHASVASIEVGVERLLAMDERTKERLRTNARAWFHDNHARFTAAVRRAAECAMKG